MTTTTIQRPETIRLAGALKRRTPFLDGSSTIDHAEKELRRQHAEIARLTAENDALKAKMELVDYVLQDDIHNRLTPRVVDIAYSAFTVGRRDTPHDWFNDTKPMVMEQLAKIQKHLAEEAAHGIGE